MKSILLIEEETIAAPLIQSLLIQSDAEEFTTDLASRLDTALARLGRAHFDAILLDLNLPDSRGLGTLQAVRAAAPEIPTVVLTDIKVEGLATQTLQAGAQDYVDETHLDASVLQRILRYAIERHRLMAELQAQVAAVQRSLDERQQAEAALYKQRQELQLILDSVPALIFYKDTHNRLLRVNRAWADTFGFSQEVAGRSLYDLFPREQAEQVFKDDADVITSGQPKRGISKTLETVHGLRRFLTDKIPGRDENGNISGVLGFAQDITERWQAEEALKESEKRYRRLYQSMMDAYVRVDMNGAIKEYNRAYQAMLGYSDEELRQRSHVDLTPQRWHGFESQIVAEQILPRGYSEVYEKEYQRKDGTVFPIELRTCLIKDDTGRPESMWAIIRDVTERRRAEEEIRRQAARAEALAHTAARLNAHLDLQTTLHTICEETARALNAPIAVVDLYDDQRQALSYAADVGLPAEFRGYALPGPAEAPNAPRPLASSRTDLLAALDSPTAALIPLRCGEQRLGALAVFAGDADRQFTADELTLLHGLANQAAQAILNARLYEQVRDGHGQLQFLARQLVTAQETERHTLAHELHDEIGQNLTGLSLNLNILRSQLPPEASPAMRRRLDDSLALVGETIQRVRNVMVELRPAALDDYGLLAALRWHGEQVAARARLAVLVEGTESVPRLPSSVENALFRIAQEALTNVVKHASATQAVIRLVSDPTFVRLTIADDGIGFDPATLPKPSGQGGWGLTSMRERALTLGGQLRVESAPGQGTRIVVEVGV